jgi:hypothetical protein
LSASTYTAIGLSDCQMVFTRTATLANTLGLIAMAFR